MDKKKKIIFIIVCLLISCLSIGLKVYLDYVKEHYGDLYIDFITVDESYEIGSNLEPISFIKKTNAIDIQYPIIDTTEVGEKHYFYIATDQVGNTKEFVLTLTFTDPIFPTLELEYTEKIIIEGESFDLDKNVISSYDPIDGNLVFTIEKPENYLSIGKHEIVYSCIDKNGNRTEVILSLTVNEKVKAEETPIQNQNPPQQPSNGEINTPVTPNYKPSSKTYMFSDGFNMQSAPAACEVDRVLAFNQGYGGSCVQVNGSDGFPIGMQLIIY